MYEQISIDEELEKIISGEIHESFNIELKTTYNLSDEEVENHYNKEKNIYIYKKIDEKHPSKILDYQEFEYSESGKRSLRQLFKYICVNEVAGFLNSEGGRLYIGISDKPNPHRNVTGFEMIKSLDETDIELNNFFQNIFTRPVVQECIKIKFVKKQNKYICVIDVKKPFSTSLPILIGSHKFPKKKEIFYKRQGSETCKVTAMQDIIDFVKIYESDNQIPKPKNNDWSKEEFLLLAFIEKNVSYDDNDPKELIILHDKGWEKAADLEGNVNEISTEIAIKVANEDIYIGNLDRNVFRYLGNKVRFNFNYGGLVEISIGNSIPTESKDFSDIIKKLKVINGKDLRKFWDLKILQIITANNKILYTLPDNDGIYKNAVGYKIFGKIVEFEDLTFISNIHIDNDIDFDIVEDFNSDKTKTKYH